LLPIGGIALPRLAIVLLLAAAHRQRGAEDLTRGPGALLEERVLHVLDDGAPVVTIRKQFEQGWFVGDQDADLLGVAGGQFQADDRAGAVAEDRRGLVPETPTADSTRCASSPWTSIRWGSRSPSRGLRELPRRSYVTTVYRSASCSARPVYPAAS